MTSQLWVIWLIWLFLVIFIECIANGFQWTDFIFFGDTLENSCDTHMCCDTHFEKHCSRLSLGYSMTDGTRSWCQGNYGWHWLPILSGNQYTHDLSPKENSVLQPCQRWELMVYNLMVMLPLVNNTLWASSCYLVVKAEDSWPRGSGFKPSLWRPFFRHHSFRSKLGTKFVENSNLALLHML